MTPGRQMQAVKEELRLARGSVEATKRTLLNHFQRSLCNGASLEQLVEELFLRPTPMTSIIARLDYTSRDVDHLISWVKELTVVEVLAFSEEQKPDGR